MTGAWRHRGRVRRTALLAGGLGLAGALCLGVAVWDRDSGPAPVTGAAEAAPTQSAPARALLPPVVGAAAPQPAPAPVVTPRWVGIDDIGVRSPLVELGLQPDQTVEVPADPDRAGWFDLGTVPGQVGSAVVLGHVDSVDGPAVFARLDELDRGDRIQVGLSDGGVETFRVRAVRTYPNADFPAAKVYGDHDRALLNLVTCGGAYDADRGGYQSNVVVYAQRVTAA